MVVLVLSAELVATPHPPADAQFKTAPKIH